MSSVNEDNTNASQPKESPSDSSASNLNAEDLDETLILIEKDINISDKKNENYEIENSEVELDEVSKDISEQALADDTSPTQESIDEAKIDENETTILQRIKSNEEKISLVTQNKNITILQAENLQVEIENLVAVREDLSQWIETRKKSFAWRLVNILRDFENTLTQDEKIIKDFSDSPPTLDIEFSAKIRNWIMRTLGFGFLVAFGIGYLVEVIRNNSESIDVADPANPANIVQVNVFDQWLSNNLSLNHIQLQLIICLVLFFYYIGIFSSYSRKTSEFRQIVATEAKKTRLIENEIHNVKSARERIDSLHPQVPQILEVLSLGLHQPWEIDSKYLNFKGEVPNTSKIPECLDIAVPTERSENKVFSELVYRTMNQIQKPGWRENAFQSAIQKLSESAGFGHANSALLEIDQDQRRNGKREMLISLEDKNEELLKIGDQLVSEFAAVVQEKVLPNAQPEVISLRPDELSQLQLTDSLIKNNEENVSRWEVKLAEIAGIGSPWAPATFSAKGQIAAKHEAKPESVLIATDRVCQYAHQEVGRHTEVFAGTRPFEVSIRVDLSAWCLPEEVAIFQDYQPTNEELAQRNIQEALQSPKSLEKAEELGHVAF